MGQVTEKLTTLHHVLLVMPHGWHLYFTFLKLHINSIIRLHKGWSLVPHPAATLGPSAYDAPSKTMMQ